MNSRFRYFVLPGYLVLGLFLYIGMLDVWIPADNYKFLYQFETLGFSGIKAALDASAPWLIYLPVKFFLYQLFGTNPAGWILTAILLHAVAAWLVCRILIQLQLCFTGKEFPLPALFAGLLFLASPYQTEILVWQPVNLCMSLASVFTLAALHAYLRFVNDPEKRGIIFMHLFFILAVFSYEISFFFPAIPVLLFMTGRPSGISTNKFIRNIFLPMAGVLFLYFLLCRVWHGHWFWHGESAEMALSAATLSANLLKYMAKFFLLYRYLPLGEATDFHSWPLHPGLVIGIALAILILSFSAWLRLRKNPQILLMMLLFAFLILSLVPVLPLDTSFLRNIYPDRYGYLPSVFVSMLLPLFLYRLPLRIQTGLLAGLFVLYILLLRPTLGLWKENNRFCRELVMNYPVSPPEQTAYVLNIPSYYKGMPAIRSDIQYALWFRREGNPLVNMKVVGFSYVNSPADTLQEIRHIPDGLRIKGPKRPRPYFGYYGGWAKDYVRDNFRVDAAQDGCSYDLIFQGGIPSSSIFLHTDGSGWKVLR